MKPVTIFYCALATIVIGWGVALFALHRDPGAEFVAACEDVVKARLKAPSTYRLIEVSPVLVFDGSYDELRGYDIVPDRKKREEAREQIWRDVDDMLRRTHERDPRMMQVLITSEAQNSFGVPVRDTNLCKDSLWTLDTDPERKEPRVNGYSALEWTLRGECRRPSGCERLQPRSVPDP